MKRIVPKTIFASLLLVTLMIQTGFAQQENKKKFALAIHGGAGSSPDMFSDEANQSRYDAMKKSLEIGQKILADGGTSLEAVEAVCRFLEDDPQFNAGKGSVFNATSGHELDASIMDGSNLACGAVAGVTTVKNPITLARLVMTDSKHVLLAGEGAELFGKAMKVEQVKNDYFDTPATKKRWNEFLRQQKEKQSGAVEREEWLKAIDLDTGSYFGTVGCVALDSHGNLAAATSTGGMTNKRFGRVGDSPIIAAGTYANNETCAVSCTGKGEEFIRRAVAFDVHARMRYKETSLEQSVKQVLDELPAKAGGVIAVDKNGKITMQFSTGGMARAAADSDGKFEVQWHEAATSSGK